MQKHREIYVSAPGRICLFGEHQDYLGLPVITAAINRRIHISGKKNSKGRFEIDLPDIGKSETFELPLANKELSYIRERDYFRSVFNILRREGIIVQHGYDCLLRGNIPINSGTSSSSALTLAWVQFLIDAAGESVRFSASDLAHLAYTAEVVEFAEPGGMMDHYTSAFGGINLIEFNKNVHVNQLECEIGAFVLGDSGQPKDTKNILGRVKQGVLDAATIIRHHDDRFDLKTFSLSDLHRYDHLLQPAQIPVLEGALLNRDITIEARSLFSDSSFNHSEFGRLLTVHHKILDQKLGISTRKINSMIRNGLEAGGLGGKINGSGGGGCMFVYAPYHTEKVAAAIEDAGGKAYIVSVDTGVQIHQESQITKGALNG